MNQTVINVETKTQSSSHRVPEWAKRLEVQVLVLQCIIASAFAILVQHEYARSQPHAAALAAAICLYHLLLAIYVLGFRVRGVDYRVIDFAIPLLDILCISAAWLIVDDIGSPLWSLYLYGIVCNSRRLRAVGLATFVVYVIANLLVVSAAITGSVHGALTSPATWTAAGISIALAFLAHALGIAWSGAEVIASSLARTDPLTGIGNRRWVMDCLQEIHEENSGFAILMLDLDNFKQINDEFGHQVGDAVLIRAARLFADNLRPGDILGRYGGEEFIVVLPGADIASARSVAERLRTKVRTGTPTTVSIGVATRSPGDLVEDVIEKADSLLLIAKRTGKDAVRSELALVNRQQVA